jgi:ribonuclease P protein subunit RPR2
MSRLNTRRIAEQRMEILYSKAREVYATDPGLSRRYTRLLRLIAQRTRTKMPTHIRRGICRRCGTVLIPGLNSRTRVRQRREPHVATTCHICGHISRIPLKAREPPLKGS